MPRRCALRLTFDNRPINGLAWVLMVRNHFFIWWLGCCWWASTGLGVSPKNLYSWFPEKIALPFPGNGTLACARWVRREYLAAGRPDTDYKSGQPGSRADRATRDDGSLKYSPDARGSFSSRPLRERGIWICDSEGHAFHWHLTAGGAPPVA